ncbi:MAG: peptidoglycan DD-metalloendopeptidase family protein [Fastidiosipilaceae bacterium]|jgi:murein DD-endopeptidase MepM/ murein hydrolase activator NlpD
MRKKTIAVFLAAIMLLTPLLIPHSAAAVSVDSFNDEKNVLESQLSEIQKEVENLEKKNENLGEQLIELQQQGKAMESEYEQLNSEMNLASEVMQTAVDESVQAIEEVKKQQKAYEDRIVVLFQYQKKSTLEVLLESNNLNGFFTNMRLMEYVADADNQLLNDLKVAQEVAEVKQANAEATVDQYDTFISQKQQQLDGLNQGISLVESDIQTVDSEILNRNTEAGQVQDMITEVDSQLAAFYEQMRREAEAAQRAEEESRAAAEASSVEASRVESERVAAESREEASRQAAEESRQAAEASKQAAEASKQASIDASIQASIQKENEIAKSKAAEASSKAAEKPEDSSLASEASAASQKASELSQKTTTTRATTTTPATTTTKATTTTTTTTTAPAPSKPVDSKRLIMPLTSYYYMSSAYGPRVHPISGAVSSFHYGVDWAAAVGTPVRAAKGGTIAIANAPYQGQTYTSHKTGYGNYVTINHGDGTSTTYAHLSYVEVSVGQKVAAGERIGKVGSTGASTGPHLHFEYAINGSTVNPVSYID